MVFCLPSRANFGMIQYMKTSDQHEIRLKKLRAIREKGREPYPARTNRTHTIHEAKLKFNDLEGKGLLTIVGRIRTIRLHGGSTFMHIEDGTDRIQIYLKKDTVGETAYAASMDQLDIGDFLEATGKLFRTKKGEQTLLVEQYRLIAKALAPLPEKWHGLSDVEIRYRQRYLDLIANPEVRAIFRKRGMVIKAIREFLDGESFLEVETPILQPIPGGALARPFKTHHEALNIPLFLRVAPELYLKRLLVGGYERVYEIGRCFRNEGIDHSHNPEFTQIEFYAAYMDYEKLMSLTERLLEDVVHKSTGSLKVEYEGISIDFSAPYKRMTFHDAFKEFAKIDIDHHSTTESLASEARKRGLTIEKKFGYAKILDEIYKELIRPFIIQPTFIVDYPIELSPLAKRKMDDPKLAARFQLLVGKTELVNAFSELNDPIDQRERFLEQEKLHKAGDEETERMDEDFLEALSYGMPPAAGFGMGIDRLTALLTNSHNIKEVILFPTLKPKHQE